MTAPACRLGPAALRERRRDWTALAGALLGATPTGTGVRLAFHDDEGVAGRVERLVALEADCCAFARFAVERAGGVVRVEVRAEGAGVQAVQALFGPAALA